MFKLYRLLAPLHLMHMATIMSAFTTVVCSQGESLIKMASSLLPLATIALWYRLSKDVTEFINCTAELNLTRLSDDGKLVHAIMWFNCYIMIPLMYASMFVSYEFMVFTAIMALFPFTAVSVCINNLQYMTARYLIE